VTEILMTIAVMSGLMLVLTGLIVCARSLVMARGFASIHILGRESVESARGDKLLGALIDAGVAVPAICGGKGTCGSCRVQVSGEAGAPVAIERDVLGEASLARSWRLACQVTVRGDLEVTLPESAEQVASFSARVRSTQNLTALTKEIVFEIPESEAFEFRAGSYVQVTCPPYTMPLRDIAVDAGFRADWQRLDVLQLVASASSATTRAYSLANHRGEGRIAKLVVRLALPPATAPARTPPGRVSSFLFGLGPGDSAQLSGPFGHFVASDADREMIFIGGGVGMAPLRAHVFEQLEVLRTQRTLSYWYGGRNRGEILYGEEFERLAAKHENFTWHVALSDPEPDDAWAGATGFIHDYLYSEYLSSHEDPTRCEYYLCGPPLMIRAVIAMLERIGVTRDRLHMRRRSSFLGCSHLPRLFRKLR
jgi:Na+-transporting NADH:ubiquinone oxidoreductase subunit F